MNTITIELCAEDRERLDKIIAGLGQHPNCERCAKSIAQYVEGALNTAGTPFETPKVEAEAREETPTSEPETDTVPQEPAQNIKRGDIQKKVVELSTAGKKEQVSDVVKKYANRVSAIPDDKLSEVWEQLIALGV